MPPGRVVGVPEGGMLKVDAESALQIHFINVGQGDCTMVIAPNGKRLLIDCGTSGGGIDRQAVRDWMRQGQTDDTSLVEHQNPEFVLTPRFWVDQQDVDAVLAGHHEWLLAYKDVTSATNQRTMIAAFLPRVGVVNSAPVILTPASARRQCCLLANLNSLAYDFIARQKVGGLHLNFFIVEQLPTLPPDHYDERCPWDKKRTLESWVSERVLRLTCTSDDMRPLAAAAGFKPGVVKWKDEERHELRAELDAAYFRLYGIGDDDIEYILGTFQGVRDEDDAHGGVGPTRQRIRDALDRLGG